MNKKHYNRAMSYKFDDLLDDGNIKDFEKKVATCSREEIN